MDAEYSKLYQKWYKNNFVKSAIDFKNDLDWNNLLEWCLAHKKEAVSSITEQIREQPNDTVYILDELFNHPLKT